MKTITTLLLFCFLQSFCQDVANPGFIENGEKLSATMTNQTTTIILLRHAEKGSQGNDPELSSEGLARAETLRQTLVEVAVSAVYATPFRRTRQTVGPLATEKGISITDYEPSQPVGQLIAEILRKYRGKTVVIAGHSNTVPALLAQLDKKISVTIRESEYDNLFIVNHNDNDSVMTHLKYGATSK